MSDNREPEWFALPTPKDTILGQSEDKRESQRLAAAAPELLAELKRHFPWKTNGEPCCPPQGLGIWQDAFDAIAKAEGRA